ncbi:THUMP domain-containing protein [Palaeococcus ferrophilus]|uniref:THUMP domain-containing protein n=1 Tax=Palaeococcus ferrophilus TaxID=83868 RepID=UPI00064E2BB6|nr:THUMP domain-containing protein [Palaeococcus ferrophilus]
MVILLVSCPTGREGDASLELEWALGDATVKRTKWRGVLLAYTSHDKGEAIRRIREFETQAIFKVVPLEVLVESNEDEIIKRAVELAKERIKPEDSFAARCRVRDKKFASAKELERKVGGAVKDATNARVDLTDPDWTVMVEVLERKTGISVLGRGEILKKDVVE